MSVCNGDWQDCSVVEVSLQSLVIWVQVPGPTLLRKKVGFSDVFMHVHVDMSTHVHKHKINKYITSKNTLTYFPSRGIIIV